jgi:formimidoylglutamate deiminase
MSKQSGENYVKHFHFAAALVDEQWMVPAYIGINKQGNIISRSSEKPSGRVPIENVDGIALPGFKNCHSHAFQYAMAGMAEKHKSDTTDDFWSWREAMYRCALAFDPSQIQTIATALYIEMLKRGYTHVAEFHYLHHDENGDPYANISEISVSLLAAASIAGIRITLIPVHYNKGGFGTEPNPRQRRFILKNPEQYFHLLEEVESVTRNMTTADIGFGVHSLRAVDADDVLRVFNEGPREIPFHLHAAEQLKEVEDCIKHLGQRPVAWLLDHLPLSERFNIVHCTHLDDAEVEALAKSKANVILCPGTEGNLGDGIFRLTEFSRHIGNWCIGTDSHVSLNPLEDLRWLDYTQRLISHKRNTFNDGASQLYAKSFRSGNTVVGSKSKEMFEQNTPLDAVVYKADTLLFADLNPGKLLSQIIYTADSSAILGTMINGEWRVKEGYHREEEMLLPSFKKAIKDLSL